MNKKIYLIFSVVFCILMLFYGWNYSEPSLELILTFFSFTYFLSIFIYKDPFSPIPFYGLFLYLYTISYPVLSLIEGRLFYFEHHFLVIILLSGVCIYLGMMLGALFYEFFVKRINYFNVLFDLMLPTMNNNTQKIFKYLAIVSLFGCLISTILPLNTDAQYKYELNTGSLINTSVYFFIAYFFIYSTLHKKDKKFLFVFLILVFINFLSTGERDFFVRSFMMVLMYLFIQGNINYKTVYFILLFGVFLNPLSQTLKGVLSYGLLDGSSIHFDYIDILRGEFRSQGRNFNWMLMLSEKFNYVYSDMFFNDFLRFLNINTHSSTSLFGREVLGRTGGAGIGFSFPGQIFLTFGWIGLLFFGFVLYLILNFFRVKNNSSIDIYLYISIVFSFAYSLRADFANLLAGIFKIGIVPLLLVKIIEKIFYKKIFDKSKFLP